MPDDSQRTTVTAAEETPSAAQAAAVTHVQIRRDDKRRKRLGEILIALGYATREQVEEALKDGGHGQRLGTRLKEMGVIDDAQLAEALSLQLGVGYTNLAHVGDIDPAAVAYVPERVARRFQLIPLAKDGSTLTVAMANPENVFAIDAVESATGLQVLVVAAPEQAIRRAIDRFYGFGPDLESSASELASLEIPDESEEGPDLDISQLKHEAEDAPVVKYVDSLISHAIRDRASDIHIEPGRESVSVRIRVDGRLRPTIAPPKVMQNAVISRIKILSNLDIAEKRLPLDGRLRVRLYGRDVDLRVSTLPTIHGEKVVMRVLDKTAVCIDLDQLGAEPAFLDHLKGVLKRPNGMILVTGPTGSGKTTTLYACLNHLRDETKNIVTVEDPVEYEIDGINQVAARPNIGMTFARALRAILRQDPDVVMVGEMRDLETLEIGIRASLTGHLVLSTLHTNDAVSTVTRMINMEAEPYLIAATLLTAIAQRLVRRICEECKEEYDLSPAVHERLEQLLQQPVPTRLWRGRGCAACANTGYYGRTAVFEYFHIDSDARDLITRRASENELRKLQRERCSGSLLENALRKAVAGITTVDEALQLEVNL